MAKNWINMALMLWATVVTLLLFRSLESNRGCADCKNSGGDSKVIPTIYNYIGLQNNVDRWPGDYEFPTAEWQEMLGWKPHLARYWSKVFHQKSAYEKENFTIVMLTYKRTKVLPKLLLHYCRAKRLHKIIIIWNDIDSVIPPDILELVNKCNVPLRFIKEKENKLTNRFKPRPEIETECKSDCSMSCSLATCTCTCISMGIAIIPYMYIHREILVVIKVGNFIFQTRLADDVFSKQNVYELYNSVIPPTFA